MNHEDKNSDRKITIDLKVKTVMEVKERKTIIVMMLTMKMAVML